MGLPDTSQVPKKDQMGMDYIPVYEGEDQGSGVKISADRIQSLGVRTEMVARRSLAREVRPWARSKSMNVGQYTVAPKFEGWIEKAARQHDGSGKSLGSATGRGLQPGTRVGAARVSDRAPRHGRQWRHPVPRRSRVCASWPRRRSAPAQLGHQRTADRASTRKRRAASHADAGRPCRRRDRQGSADSRHAIHAGRSAVPDRQPGHGVADR